MQVLERIRQFAFWFGDRITGSRISIQYNKIVNHFNNPTEQSPSLTYLLRHAAETVPFYKSQKGNMSLSGFPVVNKTIIREYFDEFLSVIFRLDQLIPVVTSGSTGTPFKTYQDKSKKHRNSADTIYFARQAGFEIGHRLFYLKIWAPEKMSHQMKYRMQNQVPIDVLHLNDDRIEHLINQIESCRSTIGILGYASALELICQYLERMNFCRVRANVKSIISMSESLNDYTRLTMRKYFGIPVVARYSNLENGILAQQEVTGSGRYLANTASYYLEVMKMESDTPASPGELGRIVVTDLHNFAMPMIRYDTGDIGAIEIDIDRPGLLFFSKIEGRKLDMLYDTKGDLVSSYIVYKNMWQYTEIRQYQLIQNGEKEYLFKINAVSPFTREAQLKKEFKTYLGIDANFQVEYVDEIPLLASGKRKKIVNNYRRH